MAGLGIAQHPECLGLPVKDPLNMKPQLNTTAGNIQEQETKSALHGPCTSLKHGNHFCTCHTCAVKEGVKRAQDKEGRKNLCWKESGAEVVCKAARACMDLQETAENEVKTKKGNQIVLHYHIL